MNRIVGWIIGFPCGVAVLYLVTACLWEYRVWVGIFLSILIFLVVGVWIRGQLREQDLRIYRFNHREETPLSGANMPMVLRPDMRETPQQFNYYQEKLK